MSIMQQGKVVETSRGKYCCCTYSHPENNVLWFLFFFFFVYIAHLPQLEKEMASLWACYNAITLSLQLGLQYIIIQFIR